MVMILIIVMILVIVKILVVVIVMVGVTVIVMVISFRVNCCNMFSIYRPIFFDYFLTSTGSEYFFIP